MFSESSALPLPPAEADQLGDDPLAIVMGTDTETEAPPTLSGRGGARPGAGRPPKNRPAEATPAEPEATAGSANDLTAETAPQVSTTPKTAKAFTVLSDGLLMDVKYLRPNADGTTREFPKRGETIYSDELPPTCDVDRLLRLRAIAPLIHVPTAEEQAELEDEGRPWRLPKPRRDRTPAAPPQSLVDPLGVKLGQPPRDDRGPRRWGA